MARTEGDPFSYDGVVWKPKPLPSLAEPLAMIPFCVFCVLINLIAMILNSIDPLWFFDLFFVIGASFAIRVYWRKYHKIIAKRQQVRRDNEQAWWCQREMWGMSETCGAGAVNPPDRVKIWLN